MYLKQVTVNGCPLFHLHLLYVLTNYRYYYYCIMFSVFLHRIQGKPITV